MRRVHGLCHTATKKRGDVQLSSVSGEDNMKKTLCMALALSMLLLFARLPAERLGGDGRQTRAGIGQKHEHRGHEKLLGYPSV